MTALIIISVYLALLLVLGVFASTLFRGTKSDYMLASHSIGPFLLLMSLFGTTMTAFALVGSTGEAFKAGIGVYGMMASSSGIIHSLCFFVIGVKIYQFGQRYGYATQIEYFRDRLESNGIGLLLFPILVGLVIPYLLIGVISSGAVIQAMTAGAFPDIEAFATANKGTSGGIPPWLGSLVICCVVLIYVFFGGMRGTAWANAFQTLIFMVLGVVTFYFIAMKLGGKDTFLESLRECTAHVSPEKSTRVDMSKTMFFTYLLVPLSVGMFPHLFQHWLTAKNANSFKLPVVAHPVFIMIVWVPCVLIGVWTTTDLIPAVPSLPKLPNGAVKVNSLLPFLVKTQTGDVLGGFLTAGILAAIMSSLDSQFLCLGTIFTNDIVTHYGGKDRYSDKQQVWMARGFIVAIVAITYGLGLLPQRSVFNMGVWCFSGFASLFPLVFASLYWKRLTAAGAYAGVLAAIISWLVLFVQSDFGKKPEFSVNIAGYPTMPVLTIFLCSLVAMVAVSLITQPPSERTLRRFFA
ncbi:MAG: sodium:solute symporter family protein [Planctomycetales bacterium]|nr:sodium:solute symporter family protein [Planctomycetales bacterium]